MSCEDTKIEIIERIKNIIDSSDDKIKTHLVLYSSSETKDNIEELIRISKKIHKRIFQDPMENIYSISVDLADAIRVTIQSRDQKYKLPEDFNAINAKTFDNYIKSEIKKYNIHSNDFDFLSILSKYTGSGGTPVDQFLIRIQTNIYEKLASAKFGDTETYLLDLIQDNYCIQYNNLNLKTEASVSSAASAASAASIVASQENKRNTEAPNSQQQSNVGNSDLQQAKAVAFTNLKARLLPQSPEEIVQHKIMVENHPDSIFRIFKEIIEEASNNYEIEKLFKNDQEFQKIYKDLSRTKLSKKEKIKILYLCGFDCLHEFADKFDIIKDTMFNQRYIKDILINYLNQNQHMIAIGMYDDDIEQEPDTTKQKSNLKIDFDFNNNIFVVTDKEGRREAIPVETQVIYLLHNVMMD